MRKCILFVKLCVEMASNPHFDGGRLSIGHHFKKRMIQRQRSGEALNGLQK
jgi:hypothetical protein